MSEENYRAKQQLEEHAATDTLTGLYNRQHLKTRFVEEIARAKRTQKPLSVVVIDMDDFQALNDELGQEQGDLALKGVAKTLTQCTEPMEIVARLGEDEFLVLLPDTTTEIALAFADRFNRQLKLALAFQFHGLIGASIGIETTGGIHDTDEQTLMKAATKALSVSKSSGKDRATHARDLAS